MAPNGWFHKLQVILLTLVALLFSVPAVWAATYYVDATNGNDLNNGLSISTAWKTLAKLNASTFAPGDQILLKRGELWRENILLGWSGLPDNPILFAAYGTGDRPIVTGSQPITEWTPAGGNIFLATVPAETLKVFYNGAPLTHNTTSFQNLGSNQWNWDSNTLYINVGAHPSNGLVEIITLDSTNNGFALWDGTQIPGRGGRSYVTIDGIHIRHFKLNGIQAVNTDHVIVRNCLIQFIGPGDAFGANNPVGIGLNHNASNALIENNVIHDITDDYWQDTGAAGVYVGTAYRGTLYVAQNNTIRNNDIFRVNTGIPIKYGSKNNIIEANTIHDASYAGITSVGDMSGAGNILRYNQIYDIAADGSMGIMVFNNTAVHYNIIYNCYNGIFINTNTTDYENRMNAGMNNTIYNNTFHKNVIGVTFANERNARSNVLKNNIMYDTRGIWFNISNSDIIANTYDHNSYYRSDDPHFFYLGGTGYTFAEWQSRSGQEAHSLWEDPKLSNIGKHDYTLTPTSPCVDKGEAVGLQRDISGSVVPQGNGVDIGAYELSGKVGPNAPANLRILP
jgi:hypothetical protein